MTSSTNIQTASVDIHDAVQRYRENVSNEVKLPFNPEMYYQRRSRLYHLLDKYAARSLIPLLVFSVIIFVSFFTDDQAAYIILAFVLPFPLYKGLGVFIEDIRKDAQIKEAIERFYENQNVIRRTDNFLRSAIDGALENFKESSLDFASVEESSIPLAPESFLVQGKQESEIQNISFDHFNIEHIASGNIYGRSLIPGQHSLIIVKGQIDYRNLTIIPNEVAEVDYQFVSEIVSVQQKELRIGLSNGKKYHVFSDKRDTLRGLIRRNTQASDSQYRKKDA